jgi:hypothetical protein
MAFPSRESASVTVNGQEKQLQSTNMRFLPVILSLPITDPTIPGRV